jgi:hypothetical protein
MMKFRVNFSRPVIRAAVFKRSWWKILLIGFLLAIGISLWPMAKCAVADCGVRDKWCNGDCSQGCGPTNGLGAVVGCSRGRFYCIEDFVSDGWGVNCQNANDCAVTDCASGNGCRLVGDGQWDVGSCGAFPTCRYASRVIDVTCCGGGAPPCPSNPPSITNAALQPTPEFPLVLGQDPQRQGIQISGITALGGEHDCSTGTITSLAVQISLSADSVAKIKGELARKYPGAHVKGTYPISPVLTTTGLNTSTAITSFHFDPLDPGDYELTVTATQDDGQTVIKVFTVHAALYESTITH